MDTEKGQVEMRCADENFSLRTFLVVEVLENGELDYACEHCGWLQTSVASGAAELCRSATWHDEAAYQRYAEVARSGGLAVPAKGRSA
jgi:hypothetical protein